MPSGVVGSDVEDRRRCRTQGPDESELVGGQLEDEHLGVAGADRRHRDADVACGTGDQLRLLAENGIDAVGVDMSEAMLKICRKANLTSDCLLQDASSMAFHGHCFDLVMISFALHETGWVSAEKILKDVVPLISLVYRVPLRRWSCRACAKTSSSPMLSMRAIILFITMCNTTKPRVVQAVVVSLMRIKSFNFARL